ncbi:uncharacterized protein V1518DRAFT_58907 [Limtongia smithiae]|uniref:uncharacterized protein n=1 Tax=Limtongia smithiae TaxID=1125753 RepID=UPI0034CF5761
MKISIPVNSTSTETTTRRPCPTNLSRLTRQSVPLATSTLKSRERSCKAIYLGQCVVPDADANSDLEADLKISSFTPTVANHCRSKSGLEFFGLARSETLVLLGQYEFRVYHGCISLLGGVLAPTSTFHRVYAQLTESLPVLTGTSAHFPAAVAAVKGVSTESLIELLKAEVPVRTAENLARNDCVIAVRSVRSGLENLEKVCLNMPCSFGISHAEGSSYTPLYTRAEGQSFPALTREPGRTWGSAMHSVISTVIDRATKHYGTPPRIVVCGPKNAGKSTFTRCLLNAMLTASIDDVAYLDLDPGQPEFGLAGVLTLARMRAPVFGSAMSHATLDAATVVAATHFGYLTPRDAPTQYVEQARALCSQQWSNDRETFPVVVNTPGWTKGEGVRVLREVFLITQADIVIYIGPHFDEAEMQTSQNDSDAYGELPRMLMSYIRMTSIGRSKRDLPRLIQITPMDTPDWTKSSKEQQQMAKYSAADLRVAQTMAYFHHTAPGRWDFETHLTHMRPYAVRWAAADDTDAEEEIGIVDAVDILDDDDGVRHTPDVITAINGTILAFVLVPKDTTLDISHTALTSTTTIPVLRTSFSTPPTKLAGLCILAGIDIPARTFHILLPPPAREAIMAAGEKHHVVLIRGRLPLPVYAAWDGSQTGTAGAAWRDVPYLGMDETEEAQGGSERAVTTMMTMNRSTTTTGNPTTAATLSGALTGGAGGVIGGQELRVRRNMMRRGRGRRVAPLQR